MRDRIESSEWPQVGLVTRKCQVTIPSMMCNKLQIKRGTLVKITCTEKSVVLTPIKPFEELRGSLKKYIK